ncbi:hypothetical protein J2755_000441 [Methanohalophilus levihalophilus]|nr:hypothetical protein [Methanohalophilus levihalophilus]
MDISIRPEEEVETSDKEFPFREKHVTASQLFSE